MKRYILALCTSVIFLIMPVYCLNKTEQNPGQPIPPRALPACMPLPQKPDKRNSTHRPGAKRLAAIPEEREV